MRDLTDAVAAWRGRFERDHELEGEHLDELEAHVLESAEALLEKGLDAEEAVLVAAHRLGAGDALREEYAKVHPDASWLRRVQWMLAGYLLVSALVLVARIASDVGAAALVGRLPMPWGALGNYALTLFSFAASAWLLARLLRASRLAVRLRSGAWKLAGSRLGALRAFLVALAAFLLLGLVASVGAWLLESRAMESGFTMLHSNAHIFGMLLVPAFAAAAIVELERRRRGAAPA